MPQGRGEDDQTKLVSDPAATAVEAETDVLEPSKRSLSCSKSRGNGDKYVIPRQGADL